MIEYKTGNLLTENVEAIVNTVNCVGVMGRGIALQFKKSYPENFKAYALACKQKEIVPGRMFVYELGGLANPRYIINFPTKRHWRDASSIDDIHAGLKNLRRVLEENHIHSIALPPLGCGLGGLHWPDVRTLIEKNLNDIQNVNIIVFEPKGAPPIKEIAHNYEAPKMTKGRAALVKLIDNYLRGLLDPFISLLEIHKLMYFMQEAGEPLRLRYNKAPYGPYAENLRHVLNAIEGHMISGYADGGDEPTKLLKIVPGAVNNAADFLTEHPETNAHFERVTGLVEGFETPFGLELLSTVHWIMKYESVTTSENVIKQTYAWNQHKKQFTPRQIELAMKVLIDKKWIV